MYIKSWWHTSHECEACDKNHCGSAALIQMDDGREHIICSDCASDLPKAQGIILAREANKPVGARKGR